MSFAAFHADNNNVSPGTLTSGAYAQLTFSRTTFNHGNYFASNAWVPPAGKVRLGGNFRTTGVAIGSGAVTSAAIYKNGAILTAVDAQTMDLDSLVWGVQADDSANGTDSYTFYGFINSGGAATISGAPIDTNFWGYSTGSLVGFRAHNNGVDYTAPGNVFSQLNFSTANYNDGSYFSSNAWTPPAGKVSMIAGVEYTNDEGVAPDNNILAIYKNGSSLFNTNTAAVRFESECSIQIIVVDQASGSDIYTVHVDPQTFGIGITTIYGDPSKTNFSGYVLP